MGESNLGIELISKNGVIDALVPILSEFSINPYIQGRIIGCILNCKIAYDVEKVLEQLEEEKEKNFEAWKAATDVFDLIKYGSALNAYGDAISAVKRG